MKAHESGIATSFAEQLDDAIGARDRQRKRKQAVCAQQRTLVEGFVARAAAALELAAQAINKRAHDLRLDSPATIETKSDFKGNDTMSAIIRVSMTRPRVDRARYIPDRGPSVAYNWTLSTSVHIDHSAHAEHHFRIEAHRDGWWDGWGCDIPTPECNPAGLSLTSAGEDIARRFMAWFTRYLT